MIWKAPYTLQFGYKENKIVEKKAKPMPQYMPQKPEEKYTIRICLIHCSLLKRQSTNRFADLSDDEGSD